MFHRVHTIPLIDNKPLNQRRFRYNPTQERELQNRSSIFCGRIVIMSERGAVTMSVERVAKF